MSAVRAAQTYTTAVPLGGLVYETIAPLIGAPPATPDAVPRQPEPPKRKPAPSSSIPLPDVPTPPPAPAPSVEVPVPEAEVPAKANADEAARPAESAEMTEVAPPVGAAETEAAMEAPTEAPAEAPLAEEELPAPEFHAVRVVGHTRSAEGQTGH